MLRNVSQPNKRPTCHSVLLCAVVGWYKSVNDTPYVSEHGDVQVDCADDANEPTDVDGPTHMSM